MHFLRAKMLLLSIALIWSYIIVVLSPLIIPVTILAIPIKGLRKYRYALWISTDQLVNAIHLGNPDVTVSSKVGYMAEQGSNTAKAMAVVIDFMFKVAVNQDNHCQVSIERDEEHYK